jgi:hypothetical protein
MHFIQLRKFAFIALTEQLLDSYWDQLIRLSQRWLLLASNQNVNAEKGAMQITKYTVFIQKLEAFKM